MMKRPVLALSALAASALLLGCCAAGGSASDDSSGDSEAGPIRFAVVYGVTGAFAGTAEDFLTGFNAAVDDVNAAGGVDGRQIEVRVLDSQSDPTHAVSVLTELLGSDEVPDVIVPGGVSSEALALLPQTTEAPLFSVSPATSPMTNVPADYPYHFGISASQASTLDIVGKSLDDYGAKTLGVVVPADAFGDSVLAGIQAAADAAGIEVTDVERPDPNALDFSVEWERVRAASPDVVFFDFPGQDAISRFFTARETVGATDIPLFGGISASAAVPSALASASAIENCQLPVFSFTVAQDTPPDYLAPLYDAFAGSERGIYSGGLGFDAVHTAILAFERAGDDTSAESLSAALLSEPVPADSQALFPAGTEYAADDHFPQLTPGSMTLVPCDSTLADGLWQSGN